MFGPRLSSCLKAFTFWSIAAVSFLLPVGRVFAADAPPPSGIQTVTGEILIVTDEFFLVKDAVGKSVQLRLSKVFQGAKDTKIEGVLKAGDKVEAQVEPDGHAFSIKKVQ